MLRREQNRIISPEINEFIKTLYHIIFERFSARFSLALHIGFSGVNIKDFLEANDNVSVDEVINVDTAYFPLQNANGTNLVVDIENLPFKEDAFDLIVSVGHLHSVNKIEKLLFDIKKILKPGGIFVATFVGGSTLIELQKSLMYAEETSGIVCRIFPFIDVKGAGRLIQNAGFELPVSESEVFNIKYRNIQKLFSDLKSLAETNILLSGIPALTKKTFDKMINYYKDNFFDSETKCFHVTLNMITITGIKDKNK